MQEASALSRGAVSLRASQGLKPKARRKMAIQIRRYKIDLTGLKTGQYKSGPGYSPGLHE
jgi:hypothetical protein